MFEDSLGCSWKVNLAQWALLLCEKFLLFLVILADETSFI